MNKVLPTISLCVAILAFAFAIMPRSSDPVPSLLPPEGGASDEEVADLRRRIEQVEDDNRALWARVLSAEPQRVVSDAGVNPALVQQVEQLRQEIHSVMAGEVMTNEAGRTAMKALIREAEGERAREQFAAAQTRQQQRAEAQKVKWKEFVTSARLTSQQETQLNERLAAEEQARKAMVEGGPTEGREGFRALREMRQETDRVMTQSLDEAQKTQYQTLRREERGGGRQRQPTP